MDRIAAGHSRGGVASQTSFKEIPVLYQRQSLDGWETLYHYGTVHVWLENWPHKALVLVC